MGKIGEEGSKNFYWGSMSVAVKEIQLKKICLVNNHTIGSNMCKVMDRYWEL